MRWKTRLATNSMGNHAYNLAPPSGKDLVDHLMRLTSFDMLGDGLRLRNPCGRGCFTDVVMLLRAEEGSEGHREQIGVAVAVGDGLAQTS